MALYNLLLKFSHTDILGILSAPFDNGGLRMALECHLELHSGIGGIKMLSDQSTVCKSMTWGTEGQKKFELPILKWYF